MEQSTFTYKPLDNPREQIRVLRIKPARDPNAAIVATMSSHGLIHAEMSTAAKFKARALLPAYEAISYVWGHGQDLDLAHSITVNGQTMRVTRTVYGFLRARRNRTPYSFYVWIDAICINQQDTREKSCQIPLMLSIYRSAFETIVWLGESSKNLDHLFDDLYELSHSRPPKSRSNGQVATAAQVSGKSEPGSRAEPSLYNLVSSEVDRLAWTVLTKSMIPPLKMTKEFFQGTKYWPEHETDLEPSKDAPDSPGPDIVRFRTWEPELKPDQEIPANVLRDLASKIEYVLGKTRYFDRMWTFQEACVSSDVTLMCGANAVTLAHFLRTAFYIHRFLNIENATMDKLSRLMVINTEFNNGRKLRLLDLLFRSRNREAADPRDKIYALEGLMLDDLNDLIRPDYSKPVPEVYANATRYLLASNDSLDLVCTYHHADRVAGLPSWTVDFRKFGQTAVPYSLVPVAGQECPFNASSGKRPRISTSDVAGSNWKKLRTTGMLLSPIIMGTRKNGRSLFGDEVKAWYAGIRDGTLNGHLRLSDIELELLSTVTDVVQILSDYFYSPDRSTFCKYNRESVEQLRYLCGRLTTQRDERCTRLWQTYIATLVCRPTPVATTIFGNLDRILVQLKDSGSGEFEVLDRQCEEIDVATRTRNLIIYRAPESSVAFGAAPAEAIPGDLVYVLVGCSVPVVLRKVSERDELAAIGECYLSDFMDGEALRLRDEGKLVEREVCLV